MQNHFPVLFYVWTSCIVSLSYLLLSYYYLRWGFQAEHLLQERKKKKRRKASIVLKLWSRVTNQTGKPRTSFILFVTVIHSCFTVHINKLLNLRLEVQKKRKDSIILKLSGRESLDSRHSTWFCTGSRSTFPSDCLIYHRAEHTSQLRDCSVHQQPNCYNPLVGCRLSSRTWCLPFCEDLTKPQDL